MQIKFALFHGKSSFLFASFFASPISEPNRLDLHLLWDKSHILTIETRSQFRKNRASCEKTYEVRTYLLWGHTLTTWTVEGVGLAKWPFYNISLIQIVAVTTKGEGGGQKTQKLTTWFMDDPFGEMDLHGFYLRIYV